VEIQLFAVGGLRFAFRYSMSGMASCQLSLHWRQTIGPGRLYGGGYCAAGASFGRALGRVAPGTTGPVSERTAVRVSSDWGLPAKRKNSRRIRRVREGKGLSKAFRRVSITWLMSRAERARDSLSEREMSGRLRLILDLDGAIMTLRRSPVIDVNQGSPGRAPTIVEGLKVDPEGDLGER
jgi:hypothetical protein